MAKWIMLIAFVCMAAPARGQDQVRSLRTESPELIGVGQVRAGFAVEFLHRARYSLSGLEGDLLRLGVIDVSVGVGDYAEFRLSGVCRDFLTVSRRSPAVIPATFMGDTTSDFGDLILGAKMKLAPEKGVRPAFAFSFAAELPNATNESGLGADETQFFARLALSKHLGRAQLVGNLGLAILGSAVQPNSQADLLTYGFEAIVPLHKKFELVGEVYGRQGPPRVGNESLAQVQMGARFLAAGLRWDVAGMAGLRHFNPSTGLSVGVTYEFQAFHKKPGPVTIRPEKPPKIE